MICPKCPGNIDMVEIDELHSQCPICNGQWWPPEKPEKIYKKAKVDILTPSTALWHKEDMNYKPVNLGGAPVRKGSSKSGKRRKKPAKRDIRVVYET